MEPLRPYITKSMIQYKKIRIATIHVSDLCMAKLCLQEINHSCDRSKGFGKNISDKKIILQTKTF